MPERRGSFDAHAADYREAWQSWHSDRRFDGWSVPPSITGRMWSTSVAAPPHIRQGVAVEGEDLRYSPLSAGHVDSGCLFAEDDRY